VSTALKGITPQEHLIHERLATTLSESYQREIFTMGRDSANRSLIAVNFPGARDATKDKTCTVFTSDLRGHVQATGLYTHAGATIICGEPLFDDEKSEPTEEG
jgi:hypothetical protein